MFTTNELLQYKRFKKNSKKFNAKYSSLKKLGSEPFVMPFWENVNKLVLKSFQPVPRWDFLSNRAIKDTMFVDGDSNWLKTQIEYLEKNTKINVAKITREDATGKPTLLNDIPYKTSHNTLHHLYHVYYYLNKKNINPSTIKTVVEWGGGYGNLAKLWKRSVNNDVTYIIIDTALFCTIQWLYLSTIFGDKAVNLIVSPSDKIINGKINIVPLALMDKMKFKSDLFISTWGLSESSEPAQDYVLSTKWFGAKHLLIGFQDSTPELKHASRLGKLAKKEGAEIIDISFIPNNHYALK